MHSYPHVLISPRTAEYTQSQPPSATANPMRPLHFPPGAVPSSQPFVPLPQAGLDYRQHQHAHGQQPPLAHSHQRVPSFGQPAPPPPGYTQYGAYQAPSAYPPSHNGYSMSPPMGMPPPLTSPTTHDNISTPTSTRSGAYIPLEPAYRPTHATAAAPHTHGGGGGYLPGPAPPEAALHGYAYAAPQQTGYEGYRKSFILLLLLLLPLRGNFI